MRDGKTRRLGAVGACSAELFFSRYRATIAILSGDAAGNEYPLDQERITLGRGPGVDLAFDDGCLSQQHAALELGEGGFRVRDLGSTNGVLVNGKRVLVADLGHGDRFQLGELSFQFILKERPSEPRVYELPED
jgi:pSer/pThr/pTyr-binding forkhead associated (FHA) protein